MSPVDPFAQSPVDSDESDASSDEQSSQDSSDDCQAEEGSPRSELLKSFQQLALNLECDHEKDATLTTGQAGIEQGSISSVQEGPIDSKLEKKTCNGRRLMPPRPGRGTKLFSSLAGMDRHQGRARRRVTAIESRGTVLTADGD